AERARRRRTRQPPGGGDGPARDHSLQPRPPERRLPGVALPGVPFDDDRGVIPHVEGRAAGADGISCAGWIKRAPSGVIRTNKKDATETAQHVLEDFEAGRLTQGEGDLEELLVERGLPFVEYAGWEAIDEHERALGEPHGKPRVKLCTWDELLVR